MFHMADDHPNTPTIMGLTCDDVSRGRSRGQAVVFHYVGREHE